MAIPKHEQIQLVDPKVVANAKASIERARKDLNNPEFVKRLRDDERKVYEARIKAAEEALQAYSSVSSPQGGGMVGAAASMAQQNGANFNPVGIGVGVVALGLAAVGYLLTGNKLHTAEQALVLALTGLVGQHQEVSARPVVEPDLQVDPNRMAQLLMASVLTQLGAQATLQAVLTAVRRDLNNNPNRKSCCEEKAEKFVEASKKAFEAAMGGRAIVDLEKAKRAKNLLDAILDLYNCLGLSLPTELTRLGKFADASKAEVGKCPKKP
jgi:hypothetical protein